MLKYNPKCINTQYYRFCTCILQNILTTILFKYKAYTYSVEMCMRLARLKEDTAEPVLMTRGQGEQDKMGRRR